jgi:hypothetical protein
LCAAVFRFAHEPIRVDADRFPNPCEFSGVKPTVPALSSPISLAGGPAVYLPTALLLSDSLDLKKFVHA